MPVNLDQCDPLRFLRIGVGNHLNFRDICLRSPSHFTIDLTTSHALPAVMAQVAVAVADGDGAAVVAGGGVGLELRELRTSQMRALQRGGRTAAARRAVAARLGLGLGFGVFFAVGSWGFAVRGGDGG